MNSPFSNFYASYRGRMPNPTNYLQNFHPYRPCSYCFSPYHSFGNCPSWGQFSNFSHEQMNTNFSSPGFESKSNFYNPDWSNHSDFSWQAHATRNYAPQVDELHHLEYLQFDNQFSTLSSCNHPRQDSSLEDTLKAFIQSNSQILQEIKNVTIVNSQSIYEIKDAAMANTEAIARVEGQLGYLVVEFNRIEEEELQSQEMARGQYMIDEDGPNNFIMRMSKPPHLGVEKLSRRLLMSQV